MFSALVDLLLPQRCVMCGSGERSLCFQCIARWQGPAIKSARVEGRDVFATRPYDSLSSSVIIGAKDDQKRWLLPLLTTGVTAAVEGLIATNQNAAPKQDAFALVPMPSSRASLRKRGDDIVLRVARNVARVLRGEGWNIVAVPLLRHQRVVKDQSGLTLMQRQRNLRGAFALHRNKMDLAYGRTLIVVDDVVTTGASMAEAFRTLSASPLLPGLTVLGGACAAATSLRRAHAAAT